MRSDVPTGESGAPAKRRFRNYLLDPRFQLKYTGMVVAVTLLVAVVLGSLAYQYSRGQTESLTVSMLRDPSLDADATAHILAQAEAEDRKVLLGIIGSVVFLVVAMGVTGIVVTHRLVGPAYKIKRLLRDVGAGKLRVDGRLRRGDELQDLFEAFAAMVESLRRTQELEIDQLDRAIAKARHAGAPAEAVQAIEEVRDRMRATLEPTHS